MSLSRCRIDSSFYIVFLPVGLFRIPHVLCVNCFVDVVMFVAVIIVAVVVLPFLDASSHLYMRVCPSVRRLVRPLVGPFVMLLST